MLWHGEMICNSVERTDWTTNPVELVLCEVCGCVGCGGGYAHVSQWASLITLTRPQSNRGESTSRDERDASSMLREHRALGIPSASWEEWRAEGFKLPALGQLSRGTGRTLADLWLSTLPASLHCKDLAAIEPMLCERLVASETMDVASATQRVLRLAAWLQSIADDPVEGTIRLATETGIAVEALYLDGPTVEEWPALGVLGEMTTLMLSPNYTFCRP
ncbi:MAG: hypothetical protein NTW87_15025 [Planctomycetota bacterium]|nr:hypothetical protein [Planctomycetota bacterium]